MTHSTSPKKLITVITCTAYLNVYRCLGLRFRFSEKGIVSWNLGIYQVSMSPCMILKILEVWETMLEVGMVVGGEEAGWRAPYPGGNRE